MGLATDGAHGRATITELPQDRLMATLDEGGVAVVAGFQGIAPDGRISTLGRGGSDTTAVAFAAAFVMPAMLAEPRTSAASEPQ